MTLLLLLAAAAGAAVFAWPYRNAIVRMITGGAEAGWVMILVETHPPGADVYLDGELQVTRPIQVPRSGEELSLRVQAKGYRSKVLRVTPDRTRSVRVRLKRLGP